MITDEQVIARIKQKLKMRKWYPYFFGILVLLMLILSGVKVLLVSKIVRAGVPVSDVFTFFNNPGIEYVIAAPSISLYAASLIQDALIFLGAAIFLAIGYLHHRIQMRRDLMLIAFAEKY